MEYVLQSEGVWVLALPEILPPKSCLVPFATDGSCAVAWCSCWAGLAAAFYGVCLARLSSFSSPVWF